MMRVALVMACLVLGGGPTARRCRKDADCSAGTKCACERRGDCSWLPVGSFSGAKNGVIPLSRLTARHDGGVCLSRSDALDAGAMPPGATTFNCLADYQCPANSRCICHSELCTLHLLDGGFGPGVGLGDVSGCVSARRVGELADGGVVGQQVPARRDGFDDECGMFGELCPSR